ncbi:DHS-like NAD/FAD-binding domain-containing protein [Rhypophila decipiens]|uniref:DHS-like NAD/FAD-binding domain-containing protein n=1 Tax=Rhypophila decipiens TaxID=261697 RepID=A0AAN6XZT0_9PEZI|nr:DHS-like NAD/FAD-binding domain-containing protein [Rhypophila decipiens]
MAESTSSPTPVPKVNDDIPSFKAHLANSNRIIAIIGAGLSAASGVATFRDKTSPWATYDSFMISSPAGWKRDPGLVWQFYSSRRREALLAKPNAAHYALVDLAKRKEGFTALSQNVDGLLERAGLEIRDHDGKSAGEENNSGQLIRLHGDLFSLVCAGGCGYVEHDNVDDPVYGCRVLAEEAIKERMARVHILGADMDLGKKPPKVSALLFEGIALKNKRILGEEKFREANPTVGDAKSLRDVQDRKGKNEEIGKEVGAKGGGETLALHSGIDKSELPQCPGCKKDLLRPGVVWFGESISEKIILETDEILDKSDGIDLCVVIGTSSQVWPAAGFCERARAKGARVAWVNTRIEDCKSRREDDWVFLGDAGEVVARILEP